MSTPHRFVLAPVIMSSDSASCAITQQLQRQDMTKPMKSPLLSPPSFTLRSVNEFTSHSVQHWHSDIAMQPGQKFNMPVEWNVCAARGPEQQNEKKQFGALACNVAETSFSLCSLI